MPKTAPLPRTPRKTKVGLRNEAYELLGIENADVMLVPKIEPLLKTAGVLEKVWMYLETSSDEMARILIAQKYKLKNKSQRSSVPLEAYCLAAKLEPKRVLGLIFGEVYSHNEQAAGLMAAHAQPDIVRATIEAAVLPGGGRERQMMHSHSKFTPVPKTSVTVIHGGAQKVVAGDDNSKNFAILPPIESTVRQLSDRFNEKLLGAASPSQDVIDADFEDQDEEDGDDLLT